jgi:hypothetical protein
VVLLANSSRSIRPKQTSLLLLLPLRRCLLLRR